MNITIEMGWWLLPLVITIAAFVVAWGKSPTPKHGSYFPDFISGFFSLGLFLIAIIVSLSVWLIYVLAT